MDEPLLFGVIGVMVVGSLAAQLSAAHIQQYLTTHDETHQPPGILSKLFIGPLLSTFPVVGRYREVREANGHSALPAGIFMGGFGLIFVGLFGLFALLASL